MASLPLKSKKGTVIHRTTSESLRLGDTDLNHAPSVRVSVQTSTSRKKSQTSPSCSFQITGVSLTRVDLGEDSADDLDESHTDDISRITDNETPSFSEDTDDHLPQQHAVEQKDDLNLGRFKVVKIESVAPFSRGRWTCFDYLDQTDTTDSYSYVFSTTKSSSINKDMERIENPSNMNFWDPHCHDLYHTATSVGGTVILPNKIYLPITWQQKTNNKTKQQHHHLASVRLVHNENKHQCKQEDTNNPVQEQCPEIVVEKTENERKIVASVSCTATIDTKIEHALDVVKTHLTRAVRLEVEELKIKINELVDRISYLEYENDLLRANVAPDVLARLGGNHCGDK